MKITPLTLSFGGLLAMASAVGIGRFVYTPILPYMVDALHLSKSQAGLIASANFIGYLAGALLAAIRLPGTQRGWLMAALAANVACLAAMGLTADMATFLVLRAVAGLASAFALVFSSALVLNRLAVAGHGGLSAVHFAGVGTGIAASSALVACLADWREMWFASAAMALLASIAVTVMVPADRPGAAAPAAAKTPLSAGFWFLLVAYSLFGFGYIITATFIVQMVRSTKEIAGFEPYIFILFGLSAAPSVALWTRLGTRIGILRTFAIAALVEAVGVAASALFLSPATVILTSLFVGGTFMGLTALGLIAAREGGGEPPSSNSKRRIALMTASFSFGQILGPSFAGYVYDLTGSLAVPSLAAAAALVIAALLSLRPRL
jgi:predicted MFS family arabinose efflux permease